MLPPEDPKRVSNETLAEVVRYAPLAHLSRGMALRCSVQLERAS
jgi:hypothetical protein